MITKSFETTGGHKVKVTGKLVETINQVKISIVENASTIDCAKVDIINHIEYEIDVIVEGFGSQGGTETRTRFSKDGIDYVAIIGKLPLTQDQLDIITSIRGELITARDNHPSMVDKGQYGTY